MKRRLSILMSIFICIALSNEVKSESLKQLLQKYCVPAEGYCKNKATPEKRRVYKLFKIVTEDVCVCPACNMYYNKSIRSCQTCATGTYVNNRYSTSCITPKCDSGFQKKLITGTNTCPNGYRAQKLSNC
ncbi:MAG: hypothetical protein ACI4N3_02660 [Alphaproteobacteria bacterium]